SRNDEVSQTFLPTMLFVIHADLIRDQMAADLKENASLPFARDWLERLYTALNAEIAKSEIKYPGHYPSLKFDPEYLWFERGSISTQLHREFGHNVSALCAFYRFYYWRTWRYQPLRQLQKITSQFSIYYFPKCPAYSPMKIWPLFDSYHRAATGLIRWKTIEKFRLHCRRRQISWHKRIRWHKTRPLSNNRALFGSHWLFSRSAIYPGSWQQ